MLQIKRALLALTIITLPLNAVQMSNVPKGPVLAAAFYWLTKGIGYGAPIAIGASAATAAVSSAAGVNAGVAANVGLTAAQTTAAAQAAAAPIVGFEMSPAAAAALIETVKATLPAVPAGATSIITMPTVAAIPNAVLPAVLPIAPTALNALPAAPLLGTAAKATIGISTAFTTPAGGAVAGVGVGKAIIAKVGVDAASLGTAAVVTATNGAAGYCAAVETAATLASYIGGLIPWL